MDAGSETANLKLEWRAYAVAFSPDGRLLASGGGGVGVLWDPVADEHRTLIRPGAEFDVYAVAFSPDGRTLAFDVGSREFFGTEGEVRLWDLDQDRVRAVLRSDEAGKISSLAFAPDGRSLATASPDAVVFWDGPRFE